METRFLRNAITLGLLSAIGPFAIDMYLPALPDIGRSLHADTGAVQMSLTVFFIALSLGQSVYGPLSLLLLLILWYLDRSDDVQLEESTRDRLSRPLKVLVIIKLQESLILTILSCTIPMAIIDLDLN